jgi:hypothetical protein
MSQVSIKIPFVDYTKKYNVETMHKHAYQKYIALFLSKPELYKSVLTARPSDKQDEFFRAFNRFVANYANINSEKDFDGMVYFRSLNIDKAGSANICGGGGRMSNSARKQFLDEYRAGQEARAKYAAYLTSKYKIAVNNEKDERVFIGHKEPWKNPSPELLKKEGWDQIVCNSYEDEKMNAPLPAGLEIAFIPLSIRNKVYQKWSNQKKAEIVVETKKQEPPAVIIVAETPAVIVDDELQNMMDEW